MLRPGELDELRAVFALRADAMERMRDEAKAEAKLKNNGPQSKMAGDLNPPTMGGGGPR